MFRNITRSIFWRSRYLLMVFENFCSFFIVTFKIFSKTSSIEHVCPGSKKLDTNFNHHWSQVKTGQFQIFGAIVFSGRVKEEGKIPVKNFTDPEPNHLWTNSTIRNLDSHFKPKFPTHRFQPKFPRCPRLFLPKISIFIKFSIQLSSSSEKISPSTSSRSIYSEL